MQLDSVTIFHCEFHLLQSKPQEFTCKDKLISIKKYQMLIVLPCNDDGGGCNRHLIVSRYCGFLLHQLFNPVSIYAPFLACGICGPFFSCLQCKNNHQNPFFDHSPYLSKKILLSSSLCSRLSLCTLDLKGPFHCNLCNRYYKKNFFPSQGRMKMHQLCVLPNRLLWHLKE